MQVSNTGMLQWSHNLNAAPAPNILPNGPVVGITSPTQGGIYVGDVLGNLYSLTSAGTTAWQISLPGGTQVLPNAVGLNGTVYAVRPYENLDAVSPGGTLKRELSVPGGLSPLANLAISTACEPAGAYASTIYAGNTCGVLYALNVDGSICLPPGAPLRLILICPVQFLSKVSRDILYTLLCLFR